MSSVYDDPVYAYQRLGNGSLAVNGEVRPDDTECAVTNKDLYPFLTIDLLNRFHVGRVVFTNRKTTGMVLQYMSNYVKSLHVSESRFNIKCKLISKKFL